MLYINVIFVTIFYSYSYRSFKKNRSYVTYVVPHQSGRFQNVMKREKQNYVQL